MTSVKEETLPNYAVPLARAGYTVLTFDNRNFGESAGEPRQHLDTWEQVHDLRNAVSFLRTRKDVLADRLALCCVCMGAGYGLEVAAFDPRVKVAALVGGAYNNAEAYRSFMGADALHGFFDWLSQMRQKQFESGELQYMPVIAGPPTYGPAAIPVQEGYEYYSRAHDIVAPTWENRLTVASMEALGSWSIVPHARLLSIPLLVVHGTTDVLLPPRFAREVYELATGPKRLHMVETHNHVEIYDQAPYVPEAIDAILSWYGTHFPAV
jgi:hypothetical protein